jgi:AcrR family transcriptional regulator
MQLKDQKTEEKIIQAAKIAFMKYGLYGARMQDIADQAGINKALLHYYFRNKEKLFDYVFDGALSSYFEQMLVFSDTSLPIIERINKYIDNIITFLSEYPQMSMFIIKEISVNQELFYEKVKQLKKGNGVHLLSLLQDGIASGELKMVDPIVFMMNIHSLCAYPFIASPIFNAIIQGSGVAFDDSDNEKLKKSVKEFVSYKLTKS